jgi:hypothetical protein
VNPTSSVLVETSQSLAATTSSDPATVDTICSALAVAAAENDLPIDFFTRLIWKPGMPIYRIPGNASPDLFARSSKRSETPLRTAGTDIAGGK